MSTLNNYKTEMLKLETYIAQQERSSRAPVTGDDFDFHINETLSIETSVLAHDDDSYTIDMDETAYNWLEEMGVFDEDTITQAIVEDANTFNYAIEYHVGGVDSDATKVLRVIPVKETGMGPMYPEYVRAEIKKHPINKAMIEKGYRPGQTRGVWQGSIDAEIADAKEQLKLNLIAPRKQAYSRTVEDLEFVKRHLDGKEYKTSFGRETTEDIDEAGFMDKVKGALGMGKKAAPVAPTVPAATPAAIPKPAARKFQPGRYDFGRISAWNSITPISQGGNRGASNHTPGFRYLTTLGRRGGGAIVKLDDGHFYHVEVGTDGRTVKLSNSSKTQEQKVDWDPKNSMYKYSPLGEPEPIVLLRKKIGEDVVEDSVTEAEYQGREVKLGKPMSGDVRKYKVYVRDPKTGNTKKVNFGDPNMQIKRDDPKRRKSFRARHGCGTPRASDRTKAAYWSCRMWSTKPVSQILKGK